MSAKKMDVSVWFTKIKGDAAAGGMTWVYALIALSVIVRVFGRSKYPPLPVCDCSVHDITTPGAAHADDCPSATHND